MKKNSTSLIITLLILSIQSVCAQKLTVHEPSFDSIRIESQNPNSQYYFPKLMKLYESNDTVMKIDQYRHLYYGYTFQEDYNPYRKSEYSNIIEPLYFKAKHTSSECDTIIKYAEMSLADNPFDLRQMTFFIIALKEKKKFARAAIWQYRLNHLVAAILSSGNGSEEHPWYVIYPAHEYNIVNFMNLIAIKHTDIGNNIDYLQVKKKDDKTPDGYYFDVSKIIETYNKKFTDK